MANDLIVPCPNCGTRNRLRPIAEGSPRCAVCHAPLPWSVEADATSFEAEIRSSLPVLVDFWAPWCGPCRMIEPGLEQLAQNYAGALKIVRLNVDTAPDIAARYGAQSIPLLVLLQNGEERERIVGALPPRGLDARVAPHLTKAQTAGEPA